MNIIKRWQKFRKDNIVPIAFTFGIITWIFLYIIKSDFAGRSYFKFSSTVSVLLSVTVFIIEKMDGVDNNEN